MDTSHIFSLTIAAPSAIRGAICDWFENNQPHIALLFRTPSGKEPVPSPCVTACVFDHDREPDDSPEFNAWVDGIDLTLQSLK